MCIVQRCIPELSSLLVNMKREAKASVAVPLRTAIWNWIDLFPLEYNAALGKHRQLEGAPERVFDLLWDIADLANARAIWPTLAALCCISAERTRMESQRPGGDRPGGGPKTNWQKVILFCPLIFSTLYVLKLVSNNSF